MVVKVTGHQALAWRLHRHMLDPIGTASVPGVVRRLGGVQAQVASSADLAIRLRRQRSGPGDVDRALAGGRIIKTWAMRGALHLLTPEESGAFLAVLAAGRGWERPGWDAWFEMNPRRWDLLRIAARAALADGPLTRQELGERVSFSPELRHLREHFNSSWGTVLHPLAIQGDLCIGPSRDGRATFQLLGTNPRFPGLPDPDTAGIRVLETYLRAYGPATVDNVYHWTGVAKRRVRGWFAALEDRLATVEVDGEPAVLMHDDVRQLADTSPTGAVRLLPGFDQWVLGPGTKDGRVIPPGRRAAVSRQAGWISPVVLAGGRVAGTWQQDRDTVRIAWFAEAGRPPKRALQAEVTRLSAIVDQDLQTAITLD